MEHFYYDPAVYDHGRDDTGPSTATYIENHPSINTSRSSQSSTSRSLASGKSTDSKPRLSKEQADILEHHFQLHPKPTSITKGGFANHLGVPVEKVNNWFQNRRAKVKQDAKKRQNAIRQEQEELQQRHQMFEAPFFPNGHPMNDASFVDSGFYNTINTMLDQMPHTQAMFLPDGMHHPGEFVHGFQGDHGFHTRHFGHAESFEAGPVANEPLLDDNPEVFNQFFGLDSMAQGMANVQDPSALFAFGKQFNPSLEGYNGMTGHIRDMETGNTSTGASSVMTRSSNNNSTTQLHRPSWDEQQSMVSNARPRSPTKRDPRNRLSDVQEHVIGESHGEGMLVNDTMHMDEFVAMQQPQEQLPLRPLPPQQPPRQMFYSEYPHQPILPSQQVSDATMQDDPEQQMPRWPPPPQPQPLDTNVAQAVPVQTRGLQSAQASPADSQHDEGLTLKSPKTGLAARRQKRPAALVPTNLRSASYSSALPSPSKPPHPASPVDASLRRIKSSTGVLGGRIQKSGSSSAPRSPMNLSFADGAASPKFPRKISTSSLNASAAELSRGALVPVSVTPHSPSVAQRPSNDGSTTQITIPEKGVEDANSVWANMPTTADTASMSVWSYMPHTASSIPSYASPPTSPMDRGPFSQMAIEQGLYGHSAVPIQIPHSAPPWQQSFHIPPEIPYSQEQDYPMQPMSHAFAHNRGVPDDYARMPPPGQVMNPQHFALPPSMQQTEAAHSMADVQPIPEVLSRQSSQGFALSEPQASPPQQHLPQALQVEQHHASPPHEPARGAKQQETQITFHEYQPPQPPAASSGPASSTTASPILSPPAISPPQHGTPNNNTQHDASKSKTASPQQQTSRSPSVGPRNGELFIHEYSPRSPADPSRLPPKSRAPSRPKEYTFSNHGPESFSSP